MSLYVCWMCEQAAVCCMNINVIGLLLSNQLLLPNMTNPICCQPVESTVVQGHKAQMSHLKNPIQKSVVDRRGSADGSVGKEEGSEGSEDGVGCSNRAVHGQIKPDIRAHVGGEGGQRRSGWEHVKHVA